MCVCSICCVTDVFLLTLPLQLVVTVAFVVSATAIFQVPRLLGSSLFVPLPSSAHQFVRVPHAARRAGAHGRVAVPRRRPSRKHKFIRNQHRQRTWYGWTAITTEASRMLPEIGQRSLAACTFSLSDARTVSSAGSCMRPTGAATERAVPHWIRVHLDPCAPLWPSHERSLSSSASLFRLLCSPSVHCSSHSQRHQRARESPCVSS